MYCGVPAQALRCGCNQRERLVYLLETRLHVVGERGVRTDHARDAGPEPTAVRAVHLPLEDGRNQFADGAALRGRVGEHLRNYGAEPFVHGSQGRIVRAADLHALAKKADRR